MKKLTTHPKLENMFPPLTDSERQGLEADILQHGCITPLVIWGNIIVDGHIRYAICEKYGLPFETHEMPFQSLDDAMFWAWQHQENRRNLTPYQRAELALKFKPEIAAKAKNNMSMGGRGQHNELIPIDTKKELAEIAGVSTDTLHKAEYLSKHADEETKQRLRNGETSINREYIRLKEAAAPMLPQPALIHAKKQASPCISPENTQELIEFIADRFGIRELERLIIGLLKQMQEFRNQSSFNAFVRKLFIKHCS